jgi:hypothetical protein
MSDVYPSIEQTAQNNISMQDTVTSRMGPPPTPLDSLQSHWNEQDALNALQRAIKQSPARLIGSKESPIEVEDGRTPNSVRRVLFPSPRKDGEFKSLAADSSQTPKDTSPSKEPSDPNTIRSAPMDNPFVTSTKEALTGQTQDIIVESMELNQTDKENMPPPIEADDSLASLFDFDGTIELSPRNARALSQLLKTPTKPKTPHRDPLAPLPNAAAAEPITAAPIFATPSRQIPTSSPLPGGAPTGLSPFNSLDQLLYQEHFSPSRFNLSPNWLKNLKTPIAATAKTGTTTTTNFEFDADFFGTLSSDVPLSSSPGLAAGAGFQSFFDFYEDATATCTGEETGDGQTAEGEEGNAL